MYIVKEILFTVAYTEYRTPYIELLAGNEKALEAKNALVPAACPIDKLEYISFLYSQPPITCHMNHIADNNKKQFEESLNYIFCSKNFVFQATKRIQNVDNVRSVQFCKGNQNKAKTAKKGRSIDLCHCSMIPKCSFTKI